MKRWHLPTNARVASYPLPLRETRASRNLCPRPFHYGVSTLTSRTLATASVAHPPSPALFEDPKSSRQFNGSLPFEGPRGHTQSPSRRPSSVVGRAPLPVSCPGCGALAHEVDSAEPGFYSRSRKAVRAYLKARRAQASQDDVYHEQVESPDHQMDGSAGGQSSKVTESSQAGLAEKSVPSPICDRCHNLLYNLRGVSIAHPSLEDIADSIAESPFSRNHVYHVLDAADFPMSLEPSIFSQLSLAKPRTQNRRSQQSFSRKPTLSFIITRSDLLAPTKEMVDSLTPYFQSVLRSALGHTGKNIRLGNFHLVSAKRGWWTKEIKESIWKRGGGNWMVGKFNVGKSNLFEVLFPKGSGERAPVYAELAEQQSPSQAEIPKSQLLSESSLLPPSQPETPFPALPLVSNLPGTTASPIRLPFGNHKGELIDLPGLERGNLDRYVLPDHKLDLVMTSRPKVSQHTIKPGQSLLLGGGLVRITPFLDEDDRSTTLLAYPFVPLDAHVTSTEKAVGTQQQLQESGIKSILAENVGENFRSAGIISLDTDVTKRQAGSLLRAGVPLDRLPFRVYSTDLLIQGVGWIELVCQVRRQKRDSSISTSMTAPEEAQNDGVLLTGEHKPPETTIFKPYHPTLEARDHHQTQWAPPCVEVFTPDGKHIGKRIPLGAWTLWKEGSGKHGRAAASARPRRSMKGAKRQEKTARSAQPLVT